MSDSEQSKLTAEQKRKIRQDYFAHGVATCPVDNFRLSVQDTTTFGVKGKNIMVSCPECGLTEELKAQA
jgi:hypothetical protein